MKLLPTSTTQQSTPKKRSQKFKRLTQQLSVVFVGFLSAPLPLPILNKQKPRQKKWMLFFIFLLAFSPSIPSQAAIFDPIIKVILPYYERIIGKEKNEVQSETEFVTQVNPTITAGATLPNELSQTYQTQDTPTPELLALLHAEFAADRDDLETALRLYKGEALKNNAAPVFERALALSMQSETPDKSLAFAQAWQDKNSDHIPVWFYVTHLALKAEDYAKAAHNLKLILAYDPKADLSQIFAGILPTTTDAQRALFTEIQSIDLHQNPSLSVLKAGLLGQLNEPIPAILHLNNAINADKNNLAYYLLKADIIKGYQPSALNKFLNDSVKITKGDTKKQLYLYHARYLLDQGELNQAWQVLNSSGKLLSEDSEMTLLGGLLALDLGRYEDANHLLTILTNNDNTKSEAYYYLGISYERMGDLEQALTYFTQVNDMQYILPATKKQVMYQMLFDNPKGAIDSLIHLRQNFEMYTSDSYLLQADILKRLGKTKEAAALLEIAHQEYPEDPSLLFAKIDLMDNDDDKLTAINTLLEFDSNNPTYRLLHAKILITKNPHDLAAKAVIADISQMSEDDPDFDQDVQNDAKMLLGQMAYDAGDYEQAIKILQAAYDNTPTLQSGTTLLWSYQKLGKTEQVQALLNDLQSRFGNNKAQSMP